MKKRTAHIILCLGDIFCFFGLWLGYDMFQHIFLEIVNQADVIRFSSRFGFFVFGAGLPIIHAFIIFEHFRPAVIHKHRRLINQGTIIMVIAFFITGFIGSSWIKTQVENAGYYYCRQASSVSALYRTLVYTRNVAVCEELVAAKNDSGK